MKKTIYKSPRLVIVAVSILLIASTHLLVGCSSGNRGFWNEIELGEVDPASVAPGSYRGEYEAGPVKAVVSVQVDTVTRATASSMVILKAIEIALSR